MLKRMGSDGQPSELEVLVTQKEDEILKLKRQINSRELAKVSLCSQVEDLKTKLATSEKSLAEVSTYYKSQQEQWERRAFQEGIDSCKEKLLWSELGQDLLRDLHQGLERAYHLSSSYLGDMGECMGHFYHYGFQAARTQAEGQRFSGEWDANGPLETMPDPPAFKGDPEEPLDTPWWLSVFREV